MENQFNEQIIKLQWSGKTVEVFYRRLLFFARTYLVLNFENIYVRQLWVLSSRVYLHRLNTCSTLNYFYRGDATVEVNFYCRIANALGFILMKSGQSS